MLKEEELRGQISLDLNTQDKLEPGYSYDDVLLVPKYSEIDSRSTVNLETTLTPSVTLKIPLVSSNMDTVTGVEMAVRLAELGGIGILPRFESIEEQENKIFEVKGRGNFLVGAAIGVKGDFLQRAERLIAAGANVIVLDVAHGHMKKAIEATYKFKNAYPSVDLISGNVGTYEAAKALFAAGADCVKVGIGPGSICTTRIETGCGVPQISAIKEAAKAGKEFGKTVLADGGAKQPGDVVKALAAGASALMTGNMLSGTDEAPGELVIASTEKSAYKVKLLGLTIMEVMKVGESKKYKRYNGSTSKTEKHNHVSKNQHDHHEKERYIRHVEGVEGLVEYKGSLKDTVDRIMAGVRSGFSYCGASNITELWENAHFLKITSEGLKESHAHDIIRH